MNTIYKNNKGVKKMLDLHYLRIFYEVAKEKSFSNAARNLFINQSAVSIQIKKFEDILGSKLFDRNGKRIEVTYAGEVLFKTAEEIFQKLKRVEKDVMKVINKQKGKIIIGTTHVIGEPLLAKVLREFKEIYSDIDYEIHIQERDILIELLKEGNVDIALMGDFYINDKTFSVIPINEYPFVLVCSEDIKIEEIGKLEKLSLIARDDSIILEKNLDYLEKKYNINIENRITVNGSIEIIKNLVKEKMGYAILPYYCVYEEIEEGKYFAVVSFDEYKNGYQAVVVKEKSEKVEIKNFIEFLKEFKIKK